ncbi:hypothetical protein [Cupriavidus metallidurans]|uniref:hypothetical protein n=1 Tax=Cupriavidus metallidurans TaxID=119219 RepID=UPI000763ACB1|nr:hypothetical protein [Cupriavidus metallidurans]KWW37663.1 hypothetical protein AU374_01430 [Cupriavidus metallidurans]
MTDTTTDAPNAAPATDASNTDTINSMLAALAEQLIAKRTERDQLALELVDRPDDESIADTLHATEGEIAATEARIQLYQAALRASQDRDQASYAAKRVADAVAARGRAKDAANKRIQVAAAIDEHVATLGALLWLWDEACRECQAASLEVVNVAHAVGDSLARLDQTHLLSECYGTKVISHPLGDVLLRAGVDRVGAEAFSLVPHFMTDPKNPLTCKGLAHSSGVVLLQRLDEMLKRAQA